MIPHGIGTYYECEINQDKYNLINNTTLNDDGKSKIIVTTPNISFDDNTDSGKINFSEGIQFSLINSGYRWDFIDNMDNDPDKRQCDPTGTGGTYMWENVYGWNHIFVWNETNNVGVLISSKNRYMAINMANNVTFMNPSDKGYNEH